MTVDLLEEFFVRCTIVVHLFNWIDQISFSDSFVLSSFHVKDILLVAACNILLNDVHAVQPHISMLLSIDTTHYLICFFFCFFVVVFFF